MPMTTKTTTGKNRHERRAAEARARRDDPQAAREAVENDVEGVIQHIRDMQARGFDMTVADNRDDTSPYGDGDGVFFPIIIGIRGKLTAIEAKECAELWREITRRHPKGTFYPHLLGYDGDPRELYEFEDVRRYIREWAQFAGIASPEAISVEIDPPPYLVLCWPPAAAPGLSISSSRRQTAVRSGRQQSNRPCAVGCSGTAS
jgi:hypothetical protein